jgi:hypothetical protein
MTLSPVSRSAAIEIDILTAALPWAIITLAGASRPPRRNVCTIGRMPDPLDGSLLAASILSSAVEHARLTGVRVTLVRVVEAIVDP